MFTASETTVKSSGQRRIFLFLQGPNGQFFSLLAKELLARGHSCQRINLNAADWFFWENGPAVNYRGRLQDWPAFVAEYLRREQITDIILNGEQRDYHKAAILEARRQGIEVTVTDFGYLRPDWIAVEREGMSGNSQFPKKPEEILRLAALVPRCDFSKKFNHKFWDMARAEILAAVINTGLWFLFPRYETHHLYSPVRSGYFTAMRKLKARFFRRKTKRLIERRITESGHAPFFLFPMQLESDCQIQNYAPYPDMRVPLREVIGSFAHHSRPGSRLLIKVHPLDPGVVNWKRQTREMARQAGVADRVDYLDIGLLDDIIRASAGVVTINSTVGIIGLRFKKNVKTLGQAIYDLPGVTFQGPLDEFWTAPAFLDIRLCDAYLRALGGCLHVRGAYYNRAGAEAAARSMAERLHERLVNQPADPEGSVILGPFLKESESAP